MSDSPSILAAEPANNTTLENLSLDNNIISNNNQNDDNNKSSSSTANANNNNNNNIKKNNIVYPPNILIAHTNETTDVGNWVLATIQRRIPNLNTQALPVPNEANFFAAAVGVVGEKIPQNDDLFFCMVIVIF